MKRVIVKDVIRYHRQRQRAVESGYPDSDEGLNMYRRAVMAKRRKPVDTPVVSNMCAITTNAAQDWVFGNAWWEGKHAASQ